MAKIFVVGIERLPNRYSCEWYQHIPDMIEKISIERNKKYDVVIVDGDEVSSSTTPGAFLNFSSTNIFKSAQLSAISNEFYNNRISPGDKFLFTDAWNPSVISVRYMAELSGISVNMHSLHHAGSWDSHDFLGRTIGNKPWIRNAELSMFDCYDTNWFATNFHYEMFLENMFTDDTHLSFRHTGYLETKKVGITGWPMEYMKETLKPYSKLIKKNQIVFPHRIAPEKQLDIFKDLEKELPEYSWITCQEKHLTKEEYHSILNESKIVFSASLQETLGISMCQEGPFSNCIPLAPNRLSYTEIFKDYTDFLYPSEWTLNINTYQQNKDKLINRIRDIMNDYDKLLPTVHHYNDNRSTKYFKADSLFDSLID